MGFHGQGLQDQEGRGEAGARYQSQSSTEGEVGLMGYDDGRRIEKHVTHSPGISKPGAVWDDAVLFNEYTCNPQLDTALQIESVSSCYGAGYSRVHVRRNECLWSLWADSWNEEAVSHADVER